MLSPKHPCRFPYCPYHPTHPHDLSLPDAAAPTTLTLRLLCLIASTITHALYTPCTSRQKVHHLLHCCAHCTSSQSLYSLQCGQRSHTSTTTHPVPATATRPLIIASVAFLSFAGGRAHPEPPPHIRRTSTPSAAGTPPARRSAPGAVRRT